MTYDEQGEIAFIKEVKLGSLDRCWRAEGLESISCFFGQMPASSE